MICLIGLFFLSTIRSDPVYGKLDFILLESKPWWNDWKPMIQKLMKQNKKPIYTDALTSNVLNGVFNQLTVEKYKEKTHLYTFEKLDSLKEKRCDFEDKFLGFVGKY